jgi:hypothetical protein
VIVVEKNPSHSTRPYRPAQKKCTVFSSVTDPDPNPDPSDQYVFGPPGSGSISQRHGSADPDSSVSDPYSFFTDPDPEAGGQYGSGSGSNPDPGL